MFQVTSVIGDGHLTGDAVDRVMIDVLAERFREARGIDLRKVRHVRPQLLEAAEPAKIARSSTERTTMVLPAIVEDALGPRRLEVTVTRADLEARSGWSIDRAIDAMAVGLRDAGTVDGVHRPGNVRIAHVIAVGEHRRMPAVRRRLRVSGRWTD